ncbi:MAG: DEAD/DEAH box helicase family protein, partial [Kangiellaceae bacterium]|nr:DEAD/DEAH box helicase family protein [Kangiellaceae bacterium]
MKFTLKDYQEEAVVDVLSNLYKASKRWHEDGDRYAFSLTATTGAGKTVMAAAAFEALFYGDDAYDFVADPGAVIIWFSDDPSLNEQTRFRLLEAADKLDHTDLKVVDNTFSREKFEAGKIYFLNTQKLGKKSLLVRGHIESEANSKQLSLSHELRPDLRSHTIWDTIQNTIEDPDLTLYLVLDEAHRGMGNANRNIQKDKSTIVKRLINGTGAVPPIPIVWGISATVERFNTAIKAAEGRITLPNVVVDSEKVQESGLLKDTIILDIPDEVGKFDKVLLKRATQKIKESTMSWGEYADNQESVERVVPLMVLQVPNKPDSDEIGSALDTVFQNWPELTSDAISHVFGERKDLQFGAHFVPYISPEHVQDNSSIRVLIAKDAISTGWDCPRAEVMVSFRPAKDKTHITQLLGRMVRTPLARRIPGNDRLNAVDCLLPTFDTKTVNEVADVLMKGGGEEGDASTVGRRVLINPVEVVPNDSFEEKLWRKFVSLPSQSLPQKTAKPVKRLTALAQELSHDGLIDGAGKKAHAEMHKVLEAAKTRYAEELESARKAVLTVEGKSLKADLRNDNKTFNEFLEDADYEVIEDAFKRAARIISPDLARTFAEYLATKNAEDEDDFEDALIDAHTEIASLGLVAEVQGYLDS